MKRIVVAMALSVAAISPASADWQYTKWGMTVDQVAAASKGKMLRCGAACDKQRTETDAALLYTPYDSGEFQFTAFAFFSNQTKKLTSVRLRLDDTTKGFQLIASLKAKYGNPSSESRGAISTMAIWRSAGPDQIDVPSAHHKLQQGPLGPLV